MPRVSILLPTYNRSEFLKQAVDSVLLQSFSDFEVIITDNNSSDGTEVIISNYSDARIKYFKNDKNIGAVNNYNTALRLAQGEYIYLFSDDDIMLRSNVEKKVAILDTYPSIGLVHSNCLLIDGNGEATGKLPWTNTLEEWNIAVSQPVMQKEIAFRMMYEQTIFIVMPTVLLRRKILLDNNIEFNNQLKYMIDWDLYLKISLFASFYCINEKLIYYRHHGNNETFKLNRSNYFLELFISKLSINSLYKPFVDGTYIEDEIAKIYCSTLKQIAWWEGGKIQNSRMSPLIRAREVIKTLLKKIKLYLGV